MGTHDFIPCLKKYSITASWNDLFLAMCVFYHSFSTGPLEHEKLIRVFACGGCFLAARPARQKGFVLFFFLFLFFFVSLCRPALHRALVALACDTGASLKAFQGDVGTIARRAPV